MQHLVEEDLGRGLEVKALSRGGVVGPEELGEALLGEGRQIGFARQRSAEAADGVFDAALLPGCVWVAEVGFEAELVQAVMASELGAVVEGDGAAQARQARSWSGNGWLR